jgi:hypothetical protein
MRPNRAVIVLAVVVALSLVPSAAGDHDSSPPAVSYSLAGQTGRPGWYVSNVTVNWSVSEPQGGLTSSSGCEPAVLIASETTGTNRTCEAVSHGGATRVTTATIRIDKTAPQVTGSGAERGPDVNGWYNKPVAVGFTGTDAIAGIEGCTYGRYEGPDTPNHTIPGQCTDRAGNTSATASFGLRYDATPPTLLAPKPSRGPDWKGWYNRPVAVRFIGSDATSGLESCETPTYRGPDSDRATATGVCRDNAGNAATGSHEIKYDATPPKVTKIRARTYVGTATLRWWASADVAQFAIVRTPGLRGRKPGVVYRGTGKRFRDKRVAVGRTYIYRVVARDPAGNPAVAAAGFRLRSALISPARGATLRRPPLLRWRSLPGASYYNVQLFRNERKIHSVWPRRGRFRLARTWSYAGNRYRLGPGEYTWYVWPGYGPRAARNYGELYGRSTFVVAK